MIPETEQRIPRVGILLINFNQWDLTKKCVDSLLKSEGVQPIIGLVDNNSSGPVPTWVRNIEDLFFYKNLENQGFIAGNNLAFELVYPMSVDFVIMLNNDTEVEPDTLSLMVSCYNEHPDTGLVTPAITYAEDRKTIWHAGGKFIPRKMSFRQLYHSTADLPEDPVEVDLISGCAMMMRTGLYRKIDRQEIALFLYHEDTEKSLLALEMGLKNYLVPEARIIHHVSISSGGVFSPFSVYFTHRNRYIYACRNLNKKDLLFFRLYYTAITLAKTFIYPLEGKGNLVYWMWLATIHGVRNRSDIQPGKLFSGKDR